MIFGRISGHIDLAGCSSAALLGAELLQTYPLDRGCSIELENCGLADSTVARLRRRCLSFKYKDIYIYILLIQTSFNKLI